MSEGRRVGLKRHSICRRGENTRKELALFERGKSSLGRRHSSPAASTGRNEKRRTLSRRREAEMAVCSKIAGSVPRFSNIGDPCVLALEKEERPLLSFPLFCRNFIVIFMPSDAMGELIPDWVLGAVSEQESEFSARASVELHPELWQLLGFAKRNENFRSKVYKEAGMLVSLRRRILAASKAGVCSMLSEVFCGIFLVQFQNSRLSPRKIGLSESSLPFPVFSRLRIRLIEPPSQVRLTSLAVSFQPSNSKLF